MTSESTCPAHLTRLRVALSRGFRKNGNFRADDTLVRMRGIITGRYRFKYKRPFTGVILKAITPCCGRARLVKIQEQFKGYRKSKMATTVRSKVLC